MASEHGERESQPGGGAAQAVEPAPSVSVVVPTCGRRDSVLRLLRALAASAGHGIAFEAVVVADGARDGTCEAVDALVDAHAVPFLVRRLWQPRAGRAAACNAGAAAAAGALLVFLDDDMEPEPGFITAHLAAHAAAPEQLGVVGAAPIAAEPGAPPVVVYRAAGFARKLARLEAREGGLAYGDVYTGNFSVRREVFAAAGGFDAGFRRYGHEDYELALRLGRLGVQFTYAPAALARQHYAKDLRALAAAVSDEGRTAVRFARLHPEALGALALGRYAARPRRQRLALTALLAAARAWPPVRTRLVALVEATERRATPADWPRLFTRYDRLFDVLYWLGAEAELRELGAARGRVPFDDVARRIAAAAGDAAMGAPGQGEVLDASAPRPAARSSS